VLDAAYPNMDLEVVPGDCKEEIAGALDRLSSQGWVWAATFALIDQYAAEVKWSTLRQLSNFKPRTKDKVELWLLFADSMLPRGLASKGPQV
jgi:three-Cys-motif partner protein